jgi:CheY-like chemotaxis protein
VVIEAPGGNEAMAELKKNQSIDLILMDVVMPGKGGVTTLMEMKGRPHCAAVILMTGKVDPDTEALKNIASAYGADKVLYKPFKKDELLAAVNSSLPGK